MKLFMFSHKEKFVRRVANLIADNAQYLHLGLYIHITLNIGIVNRSRNGEGGGTGITGATFLPGA